MVLYRRSRIPGGTYFFTVTLADRRTKLLVDHVDRLREAMMHVRAAHPFSMLAWVILPDHLHMVWRLPDGDARFPMRWRLIKAQFTALLAERGVVCGKRGNGERALWARRYWEHAIRDDDDLARHVAYIHFNPVKHGHVTRASDWPHSSFHGFVARGWLAADWGGGHPDRECATGE